MISTGAGCAKTNLFVVIPTYNEAANIAELLTAVDQHAARASGLSRYQVIQVDDGSRDDTPAIVRRMSDRLPVHQIVHPENSRQHVAAWVGLRSLWGQLTSRDQFHHPGVIALIIAG